MTSIDITGLPKAHVLAALYNAARRIPLVLIGSPDIPDEMSVAQAEYWTARSLYYMSLGNRALDVDLTGDQLDPASYDQINGQGTAKQAITRLRERGAIAPEPPARPLEPSEGLCWLSAEEIIEAKLLDIQRVHQTIRDAYNQG